jgi:hypothetical protein
MLDQWIDEALPGRSPSPEFVSRLRDELTGAWRQDEDTVTAVVGAAETRQRRALPWMVAIAVAASIVIALVVRSDSIGRVQNVPATATTTDESSVSSTTTLLVGASLLDVLSAHRWIAEPYLGMDALPSAQWIEFDPTGSVLTLFDGCSSSALPMTLVNDVVTVTGAALPQECGGLTLSDHIDGSSLEVSQSDGVLYLTLVPSDPQKVAHVYMALDSFAPATNDDLIGGWELATGGTIDLAADGTLGIGFCTGLGSWTFQGGQLWLSDVDEARSTACAGGSESLWLTQIERTAMAARSSGYLVLDQGDTVVVLTRSSLDRVNDVLDLEAGTLFGFGLPTVAPTDFVASVISGERGQPTFDSGWYAMEGTPGVEGASCLSGQPERVLQWGDLVLGFTRAGDRDRLWSWSLGNDGVASAQRFGVPGGVPISTPTQLSSKPPNRVGIGTTLAEIRSWHAAVYDGAFAFADLSLADANGQPVSNDVEAVRGVLKIGPTSIDIRLDRGTITWMSIAAATPC